MATFVPYASCYRNKQAVQLLGRDSYFSLFANPPCLISQRQRLACPAPEMTLRQISQLIRILRQLNLRDSKGKQVPEPQRRARLRRLFLKKQRSTKFGLKGFQFRPFLPGEPKLLVRSRSSSSSTEPQQSRNSGQHCLSCFHPRRNSGPPHVIG